MGQKNNPLGMRLSLNRRWSSIWYADKNQFSKILISDIKIRRLIEEKYKEIISIITISRPPKRIVIDIATSKPGAIIGKKGEGINNLCLIVSKIANVPKDVCINVKEIKNTELDAKLVAKAIAGQLEKRASFRKVNKRYASLAMKQGAKGIKISLSGRIEGAEIARKEWIKQGNIPLHKISEDIDYYACPSQTIYGVVGVKVWINKGEYNEPNAA